MPLSEYREPGRDCALCPRLSAFRADNREKFPDRHNAPVPAFGGLDAALLVVGLAPGLKGANFTGRPFTGDYAGDLLYAALKTYGFATGEYGRSADDGFALVNCRVSNAVRCVPPQNKPLPEEMSACRPFLAREIAAMPRLKVILALGSIAHQAVLRSAGLKPSACRFAHGATMALPTLPAAAQGGKSAITLISSYHCSRYNTQTRRLTDAMFFAVVEKARGLAGQAAA